jgi:hypothetical protein
LIALASLEKPSILSTCPLGHVASTHHPIAGGVFLQAVNVGRGSDIGRAFEYRDPAITLPKLNVATVNKLPGALLCRVIVRTINVHDAWDMAVPNP